MKHFEVVLICYLSKKISLLIFAFENLALWWEIKRVCNKNKYYIYNITAMLQDFSYMFRENILT